VTIASTRAFWFATRGTGVVSLVLLTAIVVLGIAGPLRLRSNRWPRFVVAGLHRNLTLLALVFITGHVLATVLDGFAPIGLKDAVIPFVSPYRPVWLGLGAVAFDLLLALTATSLLRHRVGQRVWRALHWLAYASWPVALVHSLGTGTDARLGWMQLLAFGSMLVVAAAVLYRIGVAQAAVSRRAVLAALTLAVPLAVGVWDVGGPAAHGWAARAGTPRSLLAAKAVVRTALPAPKVSAASVSLPPPPYTRTFRGTLSQTRPNAGGHVLVSIRGRTSGPGAASVWVRLQGDPVAGGGVSMTASGASFGPLRDPQEYLGKIVGLEGTRIALALRGSSRAIDVLLELRLQPGTRSVSGLVHVESAAPESD
jgi:ferric reductase like protein